MKKTKCSDRFIRKGSQGLVLTPLGIWLPFVITEYEHGRFWTWKVASIRATGHRVQAEQAGGCYLWFDMPMIAWPYIAICQMALNRIEDMLPSASISKDEATSASHDLDDQGNGL